MSTDYIQALEAENAMLRSALREIRDGSQTLLAVGLTGSYEKFATLIAKRCTQALEQPK